MKKIYKSLSICISIVMMLCLLNTSIVFADVGSFESYDSGSDWGGSDWGSSDWGSSSWDSDSDWDWGSSSSGGIYYSSGDASIGGAIFIFMVVMIIVAVIIKSKSGGTPPYMSRTRSYQPAQPREIKVDDGPIEMQVQQIDPFFNKEEFLAFAKDLFVKLQQAWSDRDWSTIRTFETNELFEQHRQQLQGYIDRHQINMMERICVKSAYLQSFSQARDKDILTVVLNSKMIDYIMDDTTGNIIKGDTVTERHSSYKMTFIRTTGIKTEQGTSEVKTTNCPNCGAPTEITSSGKCEYCGSVITTGEYNWALSNLEKVQ